MSGTHALLAAVFASLVTSSVVIAAEDYEAPKRKWDRPVFPRVGAGLEETMDGLYGPREGEERVMIQKIEIFRIDVTPWESIPLKAARKRGDWTQGKSFAVIANRQCTSAISEQRGRGQHVDWLYLPSDRLTAFDVSSYSFNCSSSNMFRPATGEHVAQEKQVLAKVDALFPRSVVHVIQLYRKGIRYAKVGRIEDAEAMLATGDTTFDQTSYDRVWRTPTGKTISRASHKQRRRELLVQAIADAKAGKFVDDAGSKLTGPLLPQGDDRDALRADAARRDADRMVQWDREREMKRFVETKGGWMLVDGYRRRMGPKEGEVWLTFDEYELVRAQRAREEGPPTEPVAAAPPAPTSLRAAPGVAASSPFFVEVAGAWQPVPEDRVQRGPRDGETWVSYDQMRMIELERQLQQRTH